MIWECILKKNKNGKSFINSLQGISSYINLMKILTGTKSVKKNRPIKKLKEKNLLVVDIYLFKDTSKNQVMHMIYPDRIV